MLGKTKVALIPEGPAGRFMGGSFLQWALFKNDEGIGPCLDLSEWLFAPEQLQGYYEVSGGTYLPTYLQLLQDDFWQQAHLKDIVAMVPYTYAVGYPGPTTPWAQETLGTDLIPKLIRRVLVEGWTNDEAIAEANETLEGIYEQWQEKLSRP